MKSVIIFRLGVSQISFLLVIAIANLGFASKRTISGTDTILVGQFMTSDDYLISQNGTYKLILQKSNGNLCIYETSQSATAKWCSVKPGLGITRFELDRNGYLRFTDESPNTIAYAGPFSDPLYLRLEDNGELRLYSNTPTTNDTWNSGDSSKNKIYLANEIPLAGNSATVAKPAAGVSICNPTSKACVPVKAIFDTGSIGVFAPQSVIDQLNLDNVNDSTGKVTEEKNPWQNYNSSYGKIKNATLQLGGMSTDSIHILSINSGGALGTDAFYSSRVVIGIGNWMAGNWIFNDKQYLNNPISFLQPRTYSNGYSFGGGNEVGNGAKLVLGMNNNIQPAGLLTISAKYGATPKFIFTDSPGDMVNYIDTGCTKEDIPSSLYQKLPNDSMVDIALTGDRGTQATCKVAKTNVNGFSSQNLASKNYQFGYTITYGRTVYYGMPGKSTSIGTGPFISVSGCTLH